MATANKARSRSTAAPRTPEEYVNELRRRAIRRLISAVIISGSVSGWVLTHWPQEPPVTAESIASVKWEVRTRDGEVTRLGGCETISAVRRFGTAVNNMKALVTRSGAAPQAPEKCAR